MDANKEKALEAALSQIERQFGKGTVMRMGDRSALAISPMFHRFVGPGCRTGNRWPAQGANLRDLWPGVIRQDDADPAVLSPRHKRRRHGCAFIDAEHALDPIYAEKLGVKSMT